MKKYVSLFLFWNFFLMAPDTQAQVKTWPLLNLFFKNQFDSNGNHHGRWAFHTDAVGENEKMKTRGRYKHGYMVGKWKTFSTDHKLRKVEEARLVNGSNLIKTIEFHPNGKVMKQGVAVLDRSGKTPKFFLKDEWTYYQPDGTLDKTVQYEEGWGVKTTYSDGKVVISPAPPKPMSYKPGEYPGNGNAKRGTKMVRKGNDIMVIEYKENGDSTVQVMPVKPLN